MKKKTKAILTIAIIAFFIAVTVTVIILFNGPNEPVQTTLTDGLSSYSLESERSDSTSTVAVSSNTISANESNDLNASEQFVAHWNDVCEALSARALRIVHAQEVNDGLLLVDFYDSSMSATIAYQLENELTLHCIHAKSREELGTLATIVFAQLNGGAENDTLAILLEQQNRVSVSLEGYRIQILVSQRNDRSFAASLQFIKDE